MNSIKNIQITNKLVEILTNEGIDKLTLSFAGNSITSGFTSVGRIVPMGQRIPTESKKVLNSLNTDIYDFAIAGDNSDEHFLNNYIENKPLSYFVDFNRANYFVDGNMGAVCPITEEEFDKYYDFTYNSNKNIQDVIFSKNKNEANIVVYCGLTGKFLDNFDRGTLKDMAMSFSKINQDYGSAHSFLSSVSSKNRQTMASQGSNTQIYIIGVPNFLGIRVSEIWNNKLRKLANYYPNATFIEPSFSKFFYEGGIDIHYNNEEYEKAILNLFQGISDNYKFNQVCIDVDRLLHQSAQVNMRTNTYKFKFIEENILNIMSNHGLSRNDMTYFLNEFNKYFKTVYPHQFYYLKDRELIKDLEKKLR